MTARLFSIPYRAPNLVDVVIPRVAGRTGYRLKAAANFSGVFTQLVEMPAGCGYLDPSVSRTKLHTMPGLGHIRAVFDPATFTVAAGIQEGKQFWLRFQPVDGGVAGADSAPALVLTPEQHTGQDRITINGDAPSAVSVTGSLELHLPRRMTDFSVTNHHASASLFIAFDTLGPEYEIKFGETLKLVSGADSTLMVRGGGSTVTFSANFTVVIPS